MNHVPLLEQSFADRNSHTHRLPPFIVTIPSK